MFGILRAGAAQVDFNPMYAPPELKHQHHDGGVETIVAHAPATPTLTPGAGPHRHSLHHQCSVRRHALGQAPRGYVLEI
ncbi:MAG: hypothetical protein ABWY12_07105 [Burkholderiales bacterium]